MVCLQRATGYGWRKAISIEEIEEWVKFVKAIDKNIVCMADNCYGSFSIQRSLQMQALTLWPAL